MIVTTTDTAVANTTALAAAALAAAALAAAALAAAALATAAPPIPMVALVKVVVHLERMVCGMPQTAVPVVACTPT
jgi:hypothetical protein